MYGFRWNNVINESSKTPMQVAMAKIKAAYLLAFISAGATLLFIVLALKGVIPKGVLPIKGINAYYFIDVALVCCLAMLLATIKSRVAAIILFIYFIVSKLILIVELRGAVSSGIILNLLFAMVYFRGILGTFEYQKIKQQENEQNPLY